LAHVRLGLHKLRVPDPMVPNIFVSFRPVMLLLLYDSLIEADIQNNFSTFYLFRIVTCLLKVGIAEAEKTSVATNGSVNTFPR
jgi:hypothetical protein